MASIPPLAYIIIGVAMSAFSKFVEATSGSRSLAVFFYAGIIFVLVGVAKIILAGMKKKVPHPKHHAPAVKHASPHHPHMHEVRGQHTVAHHNPNNHIILCPRCGTRHYAFARFCMHCGQQLRMH